MPTFMKGLELSRLFYEGAVRPILDESFPELIYAAAKMGAGSDVLGFDTQMSTDHDWGPSLNLFLQESEFALAKEVQEVLAQCLPLTFQGYATHFAEHEGDNTAFMQLKTEHPVNHRVTVTTVMALRQKHLALDSTSDLSVANWLSLPSQTLLALTAGEVFKDAFGDLTKLREDLAWYPQDVWLYMMAASWQQIAENQPLMSRAGFMNDELGSSVISSSLVRTLMQLCFLQEKRYAPYEKWFGSAFAKLECAALLLPLLTKVQRSTTWQAREAALNDALVLVAKKHNQLGVTKHVKFKVNNFFSRPFKVIQGDFVNALLERVQHTDIKGLALIGGIDQISDNTSLKTGLIRAKLELLYER